MEYLANDNAAFQFNVANKDIGIGDSLYIHSNEKAVAPIPNAKYGNFEVSLTQIGKISMGATDVRKYNQSTIDTTFFKPTNLPEEGQPDPAFYTYKCGLPSESDWVSYNTMSVGFTNDYDKWFIEQEMSMFNVTNEYLENLIN
jgi:hypothetical protein